MPHSGGGELSPPSDNSMLNMDEDVLLMDNEMEFIDFIESRSELHSTDECFKLFTLPSIAINNLKQIIERGYIQSCPKTKKIISARTAGFCADYLKFRGCDVAYYANNLNNARFSYTDYPPFIVLIESKDRNITALRDMQIGKLLFNKNVPGVKLLEKRGKNRLAVEFDNVTNANCFLDSDMDVINNWRTFIPSHLISCKGIIRNVDPMLSDEDIKNTLQTDNGSRVLSVRRFRRRVTTDSTKSQGMEDSTAPAGSQFSFINTGSVVVTFSGSSIPKRVSIYYSIRYPELYIQPVIQCHKCLRYGHTHKICKSKLRCPACAEEHALSVCPKKDSPCCLYCKGTHSTNESGISLAERSCDEYLTQKKMKEIMAVYNLSSFEAAKLVYKPKDKSPPTRLNDNRSFPAISGTSFSIEKNPNTLTNYNIATAKTGKKNFSFTKQIYKPQNSASTPKRRNEVPSELLFYSSGRLPDTYTKRVCSTQEEFDSIVIPNLPSTSNQSDNSTLLNSIPYSHKNNAQLVTIAATNINKAFNAHIVNTSNNKQ